MVVDEDLSVVNIVASGKLDLELDLAALSTDLRKFEYISEVEHSKKRGTRLLIYFRKSKFLGIVTSSGVYLFTGGNTVEDLNTAKDALLTAFYELGIISDINPPKGEIEKDFEIRNRVFTADFGREINLNSLGILLGFENIEYEPEQFPGLIFRPLSGSSTILIFASGKLVVPGGESKPNILDQLEQLEQKIGKISEDFE